MASTPKELSAQLESCRIAFMEAMRVMEQNFHPSVVTYVAREQWSDEDFADARRDVEGDDNGEGDGGGPSPLPEDDNGGG